MAEVIAAFGALSSFVQLVDFGVKVSKHAYEVISSEAEAGDYHRETEQLISEYKSLGDAHPTPIQEGETAAAQTVARVQQKIRDESQQLLEQLEGLKVTPQAKGIRRITEGARKAIRSVNERKKIEQRRSHLQELSNILATNLLQLLLVKHEQQVNDVLKRPRDERLSHQGAYGEPKLVDADMLLYLTNVQELGLADRNKKLLKYLWYDEIKARENTIVEAYPNTYKWALERESLGFRAWLQNHEGLFWICGKAGSGKSTLMKFLFSSTDTRSLLKHWSGDCRLVFASFYFWFPGTALQKSLDGLLRALMYQVLSSRIDLAPIAFPSYYKTIVPLSDEDQPSWTYGELLQALNNIAMYESEDTELVKYCFFIDGLDEYSGNHLELIRVLQHMSKNSQFKLVVSSRPWNAFRNAFESTTPSLRLEDLTHDDIQCYVKEYLQEAYRSISSSEYSVKESTPIDTSAGDAAMTETDPVEATLSDEALKLVEEMVDRAEGVFLWVYLVVESVLKGIAEGDEITFLRHRVQSFPTDLNEFFHTILDRVDAEYKAQTSQALYLAYLGASKSWHDYWLIRQNPEGLSNPTFAYELTVQELPLDTLEKRVHETRTFLGAACKDLLWLQKYDDVKEYCPMAENVVVQYLHRSVYDFLSAEKVQNMLEQQIPAHFKDGRIVHQLNLARLKLAMLSESGRYKHSTLEETAITSLTNPHPALDKAFVQEFEEVLLCYYSTFKWFLQRTDILSALVAFNCTRYVNVVLTDSMKLGVIHFWCHPILVAAIGESPLNKFKLEEADLQQITQLIRARYYQKTLEDYVPVAVSRTRCSFAPWPIFLKKFAIEGSDARLETTSASGSIVSRHAWVVAKVFLLSSTYADEVHPLQQHFCSSAQPCGEEPHEHEWQKAETFLKRRIPLEWRMELKDIGLVDDSEL